jgi:uncharacterized membrane-anchored protein
MVPCLAFRATLQVPERRQIMSVFTLQDSGQPGQDRQAFPGDPAAASALNVIGTVVKELPLARDQLQAARHHAARARQLDQQAQTARERAGQLQARAAAEQLKADPHQRIPRTAGTTLAAGLAVLDAVPAYWSAEAFGLNQTSTLIVTVLLCAALGGAMWLLDLFTSQHRRRALRIMQACLAGGLIALFALRLDYLQVTGAAGFWLAAIQALALTALSAGLVVTGFVLLAHRVPKPLAAAQQAARQADPGSAIEAAQDAHAQASAARAALENTLFDWALTHLQDGIGHDRLLPALRRALDTLLDQ